MIKEVAEEFKTSCPMCGEVKLKNTTWFLCEICGRSIHEVCSSCGSEFWWNGEIHTCPE